MLPESLVLSQKC